MNRDSQHQCALTPVDPTSIESELRLAADPTTDPLHLKKLADTDDRRILETIAGNPNAPTEVLLQLGAEFPEQLLNNPVFPLLCLGELNQVHNIPLNTLCRLLQQPNVPELFFELGLKTRNWKAIGSLGMNPQTPKGILERLVQRRRNRDFQQIAKLHVNWGGEIAEGGEAIARQEIESLLKNHDRLGYLQEFKQVWAIAQVTPESWANSSISLQKIIAGAQEVVPRRILESLSSSEHFEIRLALAANPSTPSEVLTQLAQEPQNWIHQAIAENPNTPPEVLTQFARDSQESVAVLEAVARHPETPLAILKHLLSSKYPTVSHQAIENLYWETNCDPQWKTLYQNRLASSSPKLPSHLRQKLEKMAVHPDPVIRSKLAAHPKTPPQILYQLADDPDLDVRLALVNNPHIPTTLVRELMCRELWGDSPPTDSGLESDSFLGEIFQCSEKDWMQMAIALNSNTPRRLLRKLATHSNPRIRRTVAENPDTPTDCLQNLAQDEDRSVQATVLRNPRTPLRVLELCLVKLSESFEYDTIHQMHDFYQKEVTQFLAIARRYVTRFPEGLPLVLESCLKPNVPPILRLLALCYPEISATALGNLPIGPIWIERYCIAQHPNTPRSSLERLAQDGNRIVRAVAQARLQGEPSRKLYNWVSENYTVTITID